MQGYKIVDSSLQSFTKTCEEDTVQYRLGRWTEHKITKDHGPLCVFPNMKAVREYLWYGVRHPYKAMVFTCEYKPAKNKHVWYRKESVIYESLYWLPESTILAKDVKLLEHIPLG